MIRKILFALPLLLALLCGHAIAQTNDKFLTGTFTDNATNEDGDKVERGPTSSGPFSQITILPAGSTSFVDSGLPDATQFCYRVRAYNTAGDSSYTNTACGTTKATLTVSKVGSGTITSDVGGIINCGTACKADLVGNSNITLTATAAAGFTFAGWSGACSGTGSCVVIMNSRKSATATFNAIPSPAAPTDLVIQ